jgi:thymidylate kinase
MSIFRTFSPDEEQGMVAGNERARYICLTGMDGTGKTTQAQELVRRCRALGIKAGYVWARWEPFFLRPLIELYFKRKKVSARAGQGFTQANQVKTRMLRRPWMRKAWDALSTFDYWVSKRPRIRRAEREWEVLVFDRYVYDFAIDQAVNTGRTPEEMVLDLDRRLFRYFRRPVRTLVLLLSPEAGARRKQDGTGVGYLQAREPYYRGLLSVPGAVEIDASGSIAEVQAAIWEQVQPYLGGADRAGA